jgi:hypothetical protein
MVWVEEISIGLNQFGLSLSLVWEILNGLVWGLAKSGLNQTKPNFPNTTNNCLHTHYLCVSLFNMVMDVFAYLSYLLWHSWAYITFHVQHDGNNMSDGWYMRVMDRICSYRGIYGSKSSRMGIVGNYT